MSTPQRISFAKTFLKTGGRYGGGGGGECCSFSPHFCSCLEISISERDVFSLLQEMTSEERGKITDLKKCDFSEMNEYFKAQSEARKAMTKDAKLVSPCVYSLSVRSLL